MRTLLTPLEIQLLEQQLLEAGENVKRRFRGCSADEIYTLAFSLLLRPDPFTILAKRPHYDSVPGELPLMLGTNERDLFAPVLTRLAQTLPKRARVFDVGGGDGKTTALLLAAAEAEVKLTLLEPNPAYTKMYRALLAKMPQHAMEATYDVGISDLMRDTETDFGESAFDLILCIHTLYFFERQRHDLGLLLRHLKPGGRLLLVVADESRGYTGRMVKRALELISSARANAFDERVADRHSVLGGPEETATAEAIGEALGQSVSIDHAGYDASRLYGATLEDLLCLAFITDLPFLTELSLEARVDCVTESLLEQPDVLGLAIEIDGPRSRMFSVIEPQFTIVLRRAPL